MERELHKTDTKRERKRGINYTQLFNGVVILKLLFGINNTNNKSGNGSRKSWYFTCGSGYHK